MQPHTCGLKRNSGNCSMIAQLCAGRRLNRGQRRALGVDEVINYTTPDFVDEVKRLTGKRGADIVIEHVGGEVFAKSVRAVAAGGRIVTCGATAGFHPDIDLRHVFYRQISILGSTMGLRIPTDITI